MKFKTLTVIIAILIFTLTGEPDDPIILRAILSLASAAMISAIYCGLIADMASKTANTMTILLTTIAAQTATAVEPDPSTTQILLAFIVCPIIALIAMVGEIKSGKTEQEIDNAANPLVESKQSAKPEAD